MGLISALFGSRDPLIRLSRGTDRDAFITALINTNLIVLSVPFNSDIDSHSMTKEEFLAEIEIAAKDLKERKSGFEPFMYKNGDITVMPIFSSQQFAEQFAKVYVPRVNKIIHFQVLTICGNHLAPAFSAAETVILNDESKHPYEFTRDDIEKFVQKSGLASDR
ncbi:MAG: hypothetical protein IT426_13210 [Pirellulales bacterium]|nr:hypothetical protein [Pirellulales bacterium]